MGHTVILGGARTPFGKLGGSLKDVSATELGGNAIRAALDRAGVTNSDVDEVIMGMVLQAGAGQVPSRQAAVHAGLPWEVQTETINKVCASGMRSVTLADQIIRSGDANVIVAGGMESMSHAPYLLPTARFGARLGHGQMLDSMVHDGLWCAFHDVHMIAHGSDAAKTCGVTREQQDAWSVRSHERAHRANEAGVFAEEIVPVVVTHRKKETIVKQDESIREDTRMETLAKLKPVYLSNGTITAGNAPGVNDGAAALVISSERKAKELGITPLATILGHTAIAMEAKDFPLTPAGAIQALLEKHALTAQEIDLFEINEAFAAVALANSHILGLDEEKVNVNGGAVALGHPIGASGSRLILTLVLELKRRGGGLGVAAICSGAGQGDAILVKVNG